MEFRRRMTAIALTGAFLLGLSSIAFAQIDFDKLKDTTPAQRAKVQTALMDERLEVTPEQKPKIEALNLKYAEKMQPIITGSEGGFARMRQAREINQQKDAELKQLLTPEQFEKYFASKEEMREKFEAKIAAAVKEKAEEKKSGD